MGTSAGWPSRPDGGPDARAEQARGGNDGSSLIEVAKLCVFLDAFAAELRRTSHPNFIMWPMSAQLAALIIRGEHLRATAHAVGGRGGGTVGDMTRRRMRHAQSIGAPFLGLYSAIVKAAAPSAKAPPEGACC